MRELKKLACVMTGIKMKYLEDFGILRSEDDEVYEEEWEEEEEWEGEEEEESEREGK